MNYNGKTVSDQKVKTVLDKAASVVGGTIKVVSGDRKGVPQGGSKTSHHLDGRAVDLHVSGRTDKQVFEDLQKGEGKIFDPGSRYQVIHHGPHTDTGGPHVHIGRYDSGTGVSFWTEGMTKETSGKYTRVK